MKPEDGVRHTERTNGHWEGPETALGQAGTGAEG